MNSINSTSESLHQDTTTNPTADSLVQNFQESLPVAIREKIQNHFYIYSMSRKEYDKTLSNDILLPVVNDMIDFIMQWSFADIEIKREYRKQELWILEEEEYRIIERRLDSNVWNWKNLLQEICDILHWNDALSYVPLTQFFGVPVVEAENFTPTDTFYYKWISLNVLLTRQMVCEWYKYFDEYLDYITPDYEVAYDWYAHGSRRYSKPFNDGYILCINKERLQNHVASLKNEENEREELYYNINVDHKNELFLYHSIVPISCVDQIVKIAPRVKID